MGLCHFVCAYRMHCFLGALIFVGHLPQNSHIISGSFAERYWQLKASYGSSPLCIVPIGCIANRQCIVQVDCFLGAPGFKGIILGKRWRAWLWVLVLLGRNAERRRERDWGIGGDMWGWRAADVCCVILNLWHEFFTCDITRLYVSWLVHVWHDSFMCDIHVWRDSFMCDMTHSCVTWLIHMWHDSFVCSMTHSYVTWLIHVWHDSFIRDVIHSYVTWLIHTWHASFIRDMPHSYVTCLIHMWHASFICDMTHSYVTCLIRTWHDSFICDTPHSYVK